MKRHLSVALWAGFVAFAALVVALFNRMGSPAQGHGEHEGAAAAAPADLPPAWAGFRLVEAVRGKAALEQINLLHGQGIGLEGGAFGRYRSLQGRDQFTAWIGTTDSPAESGRLLDQMTAGMSRNPRLFTAPVLVPVGSRTVYRTTGMGNTHFFYATGAAVFWLAVDAANPDALAGRLIAGP